MPSNERRYIYRHTVGWEEFMKYTVEMGSRAMIYIPSFIKIGSGTQKLIGGRYTDIRHGDCISLPSFFQNKESRLLSEYKSNNYLAKERNLMATYSVCTG
jgi:hypothetical protein